MKLSLTSLALVAASVATAKLTSRERFARRLERRVASGAGSAHALTANSTDAAKLSNAAGAVVSKSTVTPTSITGTFTIPTSVPSGTSGYLSAWVGLDGETCDTAIFQTGVDVNVEGGSATYDAWYEWYPDYAYDFSGITISAGDSITATVTATSTTGGTATIKNNSKGTSVTQTFSGQPALCQSDAEWIIQDSSYDFGTLTFTDAYVSGSIGPSSATVLLGEFVDCTTSSSSLTCTFV